MQEYSVKVNPEDQGRRLDVFLADYFKKLNAGFSRNFIQSLIQDGCVTRDNIAKKAHYKVKDKDEFKVRVADKKDEALKPQDIALEVIYEDDDLAVINKPCGMVVHPGAGREKDTLAAALLFRFKKLSDVNRGRPGIVHRLDKETSGLLVIAKNNAAHLELARQFAAHSIKRKYLALVKGAMEFDENVIELPIGRHPTKRKNMSVSFNPGARYAKTYYRTLKRLKNASLLELEPFTGRTHQLRVHLAFALHPILGDTKYGKNDDFKRLALHAAFLGFIHPRTRKFVDFSSAMPREFQEFIKKNSA